VLKGLGRGLSMRPSTVSFALGDEGWLAPVLPIDCGGSREWRLHDLREDSHWVAALALEGSGRAAIVRASASASAFYDSLRIDSPRISATAGAR
jgi:hypothetical protein